MQEERAGYLEDIVPQDLYLCHRDVEPSVIEEIVAALKEAHQDIAVQIGDGLSLSSWEFRAVARRQAESGRHIVVLLNEHLPGPVCLQTFSPVYNAMPDLFIH